ncbi:hypothetical protein [Vallitalea okinawensis]|uniref:hypothetical protein n=1 Tax=Vallitalea okinawensis TaxID=2078660 RepID=UPI000CFB57DB|nr:hypothetical protein [Vallitalea okinawensis]
MDTKKLLAVNLEEGDLKNLLIFLDKVDYRGFKEVEALNKIMYSIRTAEPVEAQSDVIGE